MSDTPTITVKGRGLVHTPPDEVNINLTVRGHAWGYSDSVADLNESVEIIRQGLDYLDIDRKLLKTSNFSVDADHKYEEEKYVFKGYSAEHRMHLNIKLDQELLNKVLLGIAASETGSEFSISFGVSDQDSIKQKVLQEAVKDAKNKATILAEAAGHSLGEIARINHSYSEVSFYSRDYEMSPKMMMSEAAYAPDIEADDISSTDTVEMVWTLI